MNRDNLETWLADRHRRNYCLLVGNATTALYLSLCALGVTKARVGIPNNLCPQAALATYFSSNQPQYLDINKHDHGLSLDSIKKKWSDGGLDALICAHAYGAVCEIEKIDAFCKKHNIPLVEDAAASLGAQVDNSPVGSFGDVSVLSFGGGKIVDVGHGGALLTNNPEIYRNARDLAAKLPEDSSILKKHRESFSTYHTWIYNNSFDIDHWKYSRSLKHLGLSVKPSTLCQFSTTRLKVLEQNLDELEVNLQEREEKYQRLKKLLLAREKSGIRLYCPPKGSVYWRGIIYIDQGRTHILNSLLKQKYLASSWFPSLDLFLEGWKENRNWTPNADEIGKKILNIWLNREVDLDYLSSVVDAIFRAKDQYLGLSRKSSN